MKPDNSGGLEDRGETVGMDEYYRRHSNLELMNWKFESAFAPETSAT
jgi:hypothetical protein